MKIYCGKNLIGVWKASLDETKLSKFSDVFESDISYIHNNKVYLIRTYCGFDYGSCSMYDVVKFEYQVYPSIAYAKKNSALWKKSEMLAKENPTKYHITPNSIASDEFGEPFTYGDVCDGKFNMQIIEVSLIS